jgi:hypothetical protein
MDIKRVELLKALKACLPGIEHGTVILDGADLFIFHGGMVHSYNETISVSVPIKAEGLFGDTVEGAIKANELYSIVNKFTGDLISFEAVNDRWILKSGKARAELFLMSGDYTLRLESITPDQKKWLPLPSEFIRGLGICKMNQNKSPVSGIFITKTEIISTDGYQVNYFTYEGPELKSPIWLSDNSIADLLKVGAVEFIQSAGNWVFFKTNSGVVFSLRTLQADKWPYDSMQRVINQHKKQDNSESGTLPDTLFSALERAAFFYLEIQDRKAVRLDFNSEGINVFAERASGNYAEFVDWPEVKADFPTVTVYVDVTAFLFMCRRSVDFYFITAPGRTNMSMVFTTENSQHIQVTYTYEPEENNAPVPEKPKKPVKKVSKKAEPEEKPEEKPEKKSEKKPKSRFKKEDAEEPEEPEEPEESEEPEEKPKKTKVKKAKAKKNDPVDDTEDDSAADGSDVYDDLEEPDIEDSDDDDSDDSDDGFDSDFDDSDSDSDDDDDDD